MGNKNNHLNPSSLFKKDIDPFGLLFLESSCWEFSTVVSSLVVFLSCCLLLITVQRRHNNEICCGHRRSCEWNWKRYWFPYRNLSLFSKFVYLLSRGYCQQHWSASESTRTQGSRQEVLVMCTCDSLLVCILLLLSDFGSFCFGMFLPPSLSFPLSLSLCGR